MGAGTNGGGGRSVVVGVAIVCVLLHVWGTGLEGML